MVRFGQGNRRPYRRGIVSELKKAEEATREKKVEQEAGAARRDVEEMLRKIDEYDADGACKKTYRKAKNRVLRKSGSDFDKWFAEALKNAKKK